MFVTLRRGSARKADQAETAAHGKQPVGGNGERRQGTGRCRTESQPERCRDRHARQYIVREKKNLVPTDKGLAVYGIVRDKKIADVEMTGMWETALAKIEAGSMDADTFRKGIEVYATQITAELLSVQLSVATGETCPCPKCGSGRILFYPKVAKCSNVDCTLTIFRNKCDKQLSDKQIVELVTKRKTGLIKGFKGKNGKAFDASLVLDEQFNVGFSFPEKKAKPKK